MITPPTAAPMIGPLEVPELEPVDVAGAGTAVVLEGTAVDVDMDAETASDVEERVDVDGV